MKRKIAFVLDFIQLPRLLVLMDNICASAIASQRIKKGLTGIEVTEKGPDRRIEAMNLVPLLPRNSEHIFPVLNWGHECVKCLRWLA